MIKHRFAFTILVISVSASASTYALEQLQARLDAGNPPKTRPAILYESSTRYASFEQCKAHYLADMARFNQYPSQITRDSFGIFKAAVWTEDSVYQFSCIETFAGVIAESDEARYQSESP